MATVTARAPVHVEAESEVEIGRLRSLWTTIRRKPLGAASATLIMVLVLTAILADVVSPYDPLAAQPEIRLAAPSWEHPWRNLQQFVLPAAVLGFRLSAATMRMTRSTVLEVLREDYVRTAWAKGLAGRIVVYKHALKNALIPVVTIVGGQLGVLLAGTVVVETIFALPGMGRLTVEAIAYRDYPVVQTNVMLVAGTLVTLNLLVDMTYAWLDPRIRYG